jgi:hypothetical protein
VKVLAEIGGSVSEVLAQVAEVSGLVIGGLGKVKTSG